ncbi:MAG TPA: AAA family ATPase [Euzebyales bacterium]
MAARRSRRFVGRDAEMELVRAALAAHQLPFAVLYVHGPGGIGKTSLLTMLAATAESARATVVYIDGRDIVAQPAAVLAVLRGSADLTVSDGAGPITAASGRRIVVLIDSYERLAALDAWVRDDLLPRLPSDALIIIGDRSPPDPAWRVDPAWRDLLRVISLRNLHPHACHRYLEMSGIAPELHAPLVQASHGHPLGLSLLTDVVARGGDVTVDPLTPDLVATVLERFVDAVPSGVHRQALEVCALARVTTESLLRDALDVSDAFEIFRWLRDLSFVDVGPAGLFPHDLARDALDADLRWRDPDAYTVVFRRVRDHIVHRLRSTFGVDRRRAIFDLKFVFRNLPSVLSPVDWDVWGQRHPEPAHADDRDAVLELVRHAEGDVSAAIAGRWWECEHTAFFVVRGDHGDVRGVITLLDLTAASDADRAADPGAQAAWAHAHRQAPPRPGEIVTQTRFTVDRDAYQGPSPTLNAVPILTLQRYLDMPNLAWDYLALFEPEPWNDYFALADLPRAHGADFTVGGRRYGLFAHDFRRVPVHDLLTLWTERALAQEPTALEPAAPAVLVMSQPEFTAAVRQALRDLHCPDLLARNPLLRTRLLRAHAGTDEPDATALRELLDMAVDTLRQHPRDDKRLRAIDRTYLRPAGTQESAAALLGLAFSTYRRHLTQGVDRIVAWLWDREIYGVA